jgi:hypothetical protein
MEARRYRDTCRLVDQVSPHGRKPREQFCDAAIVKVYLFATQADRPMSWACREQHWPQSLLMDMLGGNLPSQSTMSRRMKSVTVLQLIERVQAKLSDMLVAAEKLGSTVKVIDSKPLRVSRFSKDRNARNGRAAGDKARGYKVHAITVGKAFVHWTLTGMNTHDQVGAAILLPKLANGPASWGYVSADNGYDSNPVHELARAVNHQLLAPPRRSNAEVRDERRNSKERIRSLDLFADPLKHCGMSSPFAAYIIEKREQVERDFGNAAMHGLTSPPPWVRTPHRTAIWTAAKLIQTMVRQLRIIGVRT